MRRAQGHGIEGGRKHKPATEKQARHQTWPLQTKAEHGKAGHGMDQLIAGACPNPVARLRVAQAMSAKRTSRDSNKSACGGEGENGFVLL